MRIVDTLCLVALTSAFACGQQEFVGYGSIQPSARDGADATPVVTPSPTPDVTPDAIADDVYDWRAHIVWSPTSAWPWTGADHDSPFYRDIMNQRGQRRILNYGPSTNAHETTHMILAEMNNRTPARDQFVYFQDGQGAYINEPKLHARVIREYVPATARELAASRYKLYLVDQVAAYFPNVLYQFDEWNSYVSNARVALEMRRAGTWPANEIVDEVDGAMDFLVFGSAAILALSEREPDYLKDHEQIRAVYAMLAEQSLALVNEGLAIEQFNRFHAEELLRAFREGADFQPIRDMLRQWLGDGWYQKFIVN